jgi:DNA-binding transcriptional regulator YiaG
MKKIVEITDKESLIECRKSMGLSISAMARKINTPRGTYIKWERGERRLPGFISVLFQSLMDQEEKLE